MSGIVTLGESMGLIRSSEPGRLSLQRSAALGFGGSESNVAIGLRRLGVETTWIGRVGDDSIGELIVRELRAEDVRVQATVDTDASTGLMLKERRLPGASAVWYYRSGSAGSRLSADDLDASSIETSDLLHISGITAALSSSARGAIDRAVDVATAAAVPISFDLNYRSKLWSRDEAADVYRSIVPRCDIVFAGHDEADIVVGETADPAEAARRLRTLGAKEAVIKLGGRGSLSLSDDGLFHAEAVEVEVIDTVGAGDAFVAGYLAARVCGDSPHARLALASITGAFACTVAGDWEGAPRRDELPMVSAAEPVVR